VGRTAENLENAASSQLGRLGERLGGRRNRPALTRLLWKKRVFSKKKSQSNKLLGIAKKSHIRYSKRQDVIEVWNGHRSPDKKGELFGKGTGQTELRLGNVRLGQRIVQRIPKKRCTISRTKAVKRSHSVTQSFQKGRGKKFEG